MDSEGGTTTATEEVPWWEQQAHADAPPPTGGGRSGGKALRFFFNKDKERGPDKAKTFIIVDEAFGKTGQPFHLWEHFVPINSQWAPFTCRRGVIDKSPDGLVIPRQGSGCPFCDRAQGEIDRMRADAERREAAGEKGVPAPKSKFQPYHAQVMTILDLSEFVADSGKTYKNTPRLIVMKDRTAEKFAAAKKTRTSLVGWKVSAWRSTDNKSPSVGDNFDFIEKVGPEVIVDWQGRMVKPFDYPETFAPKSYEEMAEIVSQLAALSKAADPTAQKVSF